MVHIFFTEPVKPIFNIILVILSMSPTHVHLYKCLIITYEYLYILKICVYTVLFYKNFLSCAFCKHLFKLFICHRFLYISVYATLYAFTHVGKFHHSFCIKKKNTYPLFPSPIIHCSLLKCFSLSLEPLWK